MAERGGRNGSSQVHSIVHLTHNYHSFEMNHSPNGHKQPLWNVQSVSAFLFLAPNNL